MTQKIEVISIDKPQDSNIIIGQAHFIKSVEDLYETLVSAVVDIKFGLAFCEASGACKVRCEGTDERLKKIVAQNALKVGCGHSFFIILEGAYPINVLNAVKSVSEVCTVFCATANSLEVVVIETSLGRGILGVVDGSKPSGIEEEADIEWRKGFLRKVGYKL
ncbi:MAG: adenosine-specific kinase [Candidatus Omnitrophota bacterium]